MVVTNYIVVVSLLALVRAISATQNLVIHERLEVVPKGFALIGPALASTSLNLKVALTSTDLKGLESALYDVSTPSSKLYGQHLTKAEVEAYVTPTSKTTSSVNAWLSSQGLSSSKVSPAGDWISVQITVEKANELFGANFSVFTHSASGKEVIRTLSYSLPASLQNDIQFLHPTISFPIYNSKIPLITRPAPLTIKTVPNRSDKRDVPSSCATEVVPSCLQALYNLPTTPATQSSNGIIVSGHDSQWPQYNDLETFLYNFRTDLPYTNSYTLQVLDGGSDPQGPSDAGVEANLDVQYTVGVASDVPVTFISVGPNNQDGVDGFLDIVNYLLGEDSPPPVMTTSYAFNEPELPSSIATNLCNAYMQLGARGVSLFFGSGDGGVSGVQSQSCTTFVPTFPSTCPYVTSVGATGGINPEVSASFSGGGFSNYFGVPSYQASVVESYITTLGDTNSGLFNSSGRAVPDVAAQGENVVIVNNLTALLVDGTSCSTPIFASTVALLNEQLISAGRSTLGFLNPLLYANPTAFNDITSGDNPGCNTNGFPAGTGWDPVTGLGTPNFASLLAAIGL